MQVSIFATLHTTFFLSTLTLGATQSITSATNSPTTTAATNAETTKATTTTGTGASAYPACAQQCLVSAVQASGCGASDTTCQCTSGLDTITRQTVACLIKSTCTTAELEAVQKVAADQCAGVLATGSGGSATADASQAIASAVSGAAGSGSTSAQTEAKTDAAGGSATAAASGSGVVGPSTGAAGRNGVEEVVMGLGLLAGLVW